MDGELLLPHSFTSGRSARILKTMFIRNVATFNEDEEEETTTWKRYAILPRVPGQKYTIGRRFKSRVEQGEFIYLPGPQFNPARDERPICEITVEQGGYWVTPTCAAWVGVVLINDVKVVEKTELDFGDKLSLGLANATFTNLLFLERELDPTAFIYSSAQARQGIPDKKKRVSSRIKKNAAPTPGQNGLIVSQILSYLPVAAVKKLRFVSKLWNEESFKILKKRCTVNFGLNLHPNEKNPSETMKLVRYVADMSNNPLANLRISLSRNYGRIHPKYVDDLNWFLSDDNSKLHNIKRLELWGATYTMSNYELCHRVLHILGKHLEQLTLNHSSCLSLDSVKDPKLPELTQFAKLQVFTLSRNFSGGIPGYQQLTKLIKGVSAIRLEAKASYSLQFLKGLYDSDSLKWYSNLNEIALYHITPDLINLLLKFPNRLKKLHLQKLKGMKGPDFDVFGELLSKHSSTLERLQFRIPASPARGEDDDDPAPVFINFPCFPKLESLNIGWTPGRRGKTRQVKLKFPDGTSFINYATELPSLKSLTIWFRKQFSSKYTQSYRNYQKSVTPEMVWNDCGCFFEMLFPALVEGHGEEDVEPCKTVHHLDIFFKIPEKKRWANTGLFSEDARATIQSMFPNVGNKAWVSSIRYEETPEEPPATKKSKSATGNKRQRKRKVSESESSDLEF